MLSQGSAPLCLVELAALLGADLDKPILSCTQEIKFALDIVQSDVDFFRKHPLTSSVGKYRSTDARVMYLRRTIPLAEGARVCL